MKPYTLLIAITVALWSPYYRSMAIATASIIALSLPFDVMFLRELGFYNEISPVSSGVHFVPTKSNSSVFERMQQKCEAMEIDYLYAKSATKWLVLGDWRTLYPFMSFASKKFGRYVRRYIEVEGNEVVGVDFMPALSK